VRGASSSGFDLGLDTSGSSLVFSWLLLSGHVRTHIVMLFMADIHSPGGMRESGFQRMLIRWVPVWGNQIIPMFLLFRTEPKPFILMIISKCASIHFGCMWCMSDPSKPDSGQFVRVCSDLFRQSPECNFPVGVITLDDYGCLSNACISLLKPFYDYLVTMR
jgi:hypothetical protein